MQESDRAVEPYRLQTAEGSPLEPYLRARQQGSASASYAHQSSAVPHQLPGVPEYLGG